MGVALVPTKLMTDGAPYEEQDSQRHLYFHDFPSQIIGVFFISTINKSFMCIIIACVEFLCLFNSSSLLAQA